MSGDEAGGGEPVANKLLPVKLIPDLVVGSCGVQKVRKVRANTETCDFRRMLGFLIPYLRTVRAGYRQCYH